MNRRSLSLVVLLAVLAQVTLLGRPTQAQESRWDGADNLPVNPLSCPFGVLVRATATPTPDPKITPTPLPYLGGVPTNAPNLAGKPLLLLHAPQETAAPYYNVVVQGIQEAISELRNIEFFDEGTAEPNPAKQSAVIDNYLLQTQIHGIMVSPSDGAALAPVLIKALNAGTAVISYDHDTLPNARQWYINPVQPNGLAKTLVDSLVQDIGLRGSFAIMTGSKSAPEQSRLISEMWAYAQQCYPDIKFLETVETQDNPRIALDSTPGLLRKYKGTIRSILSVTRGATPAIADALKQATACPNVTVVGLSTPKPMVQYIKVNCARSVVYWNPADLGYAMVYVMRAIADGTLKPGDASVKAGRLGTLKIVSGGQIVLGNGYVFDLQNIDLYYF